MEWRRKAIHLQIPLWLAIVPSVVYYPLPMHRQPAYMPYAAGPLPVSESLCGRVLSLPMNPYQTAEHTERVIAAVIAAVS